MRYHDGADHGGADHEVARQAISRATAAKERGEGFLELRVESGYGAGWLAAVEALGWRLEHVGYVFTFTGWASGGGEFSHVEGGATIGIYLLRSVN